MVVRRNMDELMELDLPDGWIASAHACACNPRKLKHYPADWFANPRNAVFSCLTQILGSHRIAHTRRWSTLIH